MWRQDGERVYGDAQSDSLSLSALSIVARDLHVRSACFQCRSGTWLSRRTFSKARRKHSPSFVIIATRENDKTRHDLLEAIYR